MITIKYPQIFASLICFLSIAANAQQWAIRPELSLTSTRAKMINNSSGFKPQTSAYYNYPDISLSVDYYNKYKNRWSLGLGTYSTGVSFQPNSFGNEGLFGFLFSGGSSSGTSGGVQLAISYEQLMFPKMRSNWYLGGGLNSWFMKPGDGTGSNNFFGDANILSDSMFRINAFTPGWHLRTTYVWKNKKDKEVIQFMLRVNGSFGIAQHRLIIRYDLLRPQQLSNQVATYKLTGAGIQIGFSKTLVFIPRQKK